MKFGNWEEQIHEDPEQKKRLLSAKKASVTPASIDKEKQSGIFPGSGKVPYETTLSSCTCGDFFKRRLPCKHIYRLAMELDAVKESFDSGLNKNICVQQQISLQDAVAEIENLTDDVQLQVCAALRESIYHKIQSILVTFWSKDHADKSICQLFTLEYSPLELSLQKMSKKSLCQLFEYHKVSFDNNLKKSDLIAWYCDNRNSLEKHLPYQAKLTFSPLFQKAQRSVYIYLLRKFMWEKYYNDYMVELFYPHGAKGQDLTIILTTNHIDNEAPLVSVPNDLHFFPKDEITDLLNLYGHNRCLNGFKPIREEELPEDKAAIPDAWRYLR